MREDQTLVLNLTRFRRPIRLEKKLSLGSHKRCRVAVVVDAGYRD